MSVYVDPLVDYGTQIGRAGPVWCHLVADTDDELHAFAARLGVRRAWFQEDAARPWRNHYDLTASRRAEAVRRGAIEITRHELGQRLRAAREG